MYPDANIVKLLGRQQDSFVLPDQRWLRSQLSMSLCPKCFKRRGDLYPEPIEPLITQLPTGTSYDGVFQAGCGIIHNRMLEVLMPYLDHFVLGRCFEGREQELREYRSIYFRDTINERGDHTTEYFVCGRCAFIGSVSDAPYVLRSELPDAEVFHTRTDELFLSSSLARMFPWKRFQDLKPFLFPVFDKVLPDDSLDKVQRAVQELTDLFGGDWPAAFRAVEDEVRRIRVSDDTRIVRTYVRGLPLVVSGWSSHGCFRRVGAVLMP